MHTKYLVKYVRDLELLVALILTFQSLAYSFTCIKCHLLLCLRFLTLVPRVDRFFYSYAILAELVERHVESILGYRPSSLDEF
jgi:hypothetical protein